MTGRPGRDETRRAKRIRGGKGREKEVNVDEEDEASGTGSEVDE